MVLLPKYSIGIGDRFAHQGLAQLDALILARNQGIDIAPVWNKSHREHTIIGSKPADVRAEADYAVQVRRWTGPYFVDADHINLRTVELFLETSDFFTLDVADWIGVEAEPAAIANFVVRHENLVGRLSVPGMDRPLEISRSMRADAARKFLAATGEAGRIYRHIVEAKGDQTPLIPDEIEKCHRTPVWHRWDYYSARGPIIGHGRHRQQTSFAVISVFVPASDLDVISFRFPSPALTGSGRKRLFPRLFCC